MRATTTLPRPLVTLLLGALATVAALAGLLAGAGPAAAHAALDDSTPGDGEVVATAPDEVSLTFTEGVSLAPDAIRVLAPDGERADTGEPTGSGRDHAVALRPGLADGTYTVAWQVVSADSHPVSGAFTFSIGAPSETSVDPAGVTVSGDDGLVGLLYDIGRYAAYTGFLLLVGSCVFVLVCWPAAAARRSVQRVTLAGWIVLTGATIALLWLRIPYTGSGELADALDPTRLRDVVATRTGTALVTRLLLAAAAGLFIALLYGSYARLRAAERERPAADPEDEEHGADAEYRAVRLRDLTFGLGIGGTIIAVGIAATWATSEHAATGRQTALAIPADVVHLLAVAIWLGGLVTLLVLLHRTSGGPPRAAVRRYSALATGSVAALAVTGLYQSWRQVGLSWTALTDTSYGRLLMLKVALVAVVLAVAVASRRWTARLADPAEPADTAPEAAPETVPVGGAVGGENGGEVADGTDPARARQLARQRAAIERAARLRARDADPVRSGLRRSMLAEAAIAAVLLGVTTALTATTPAHTAATEAAADTAGGGAADRPAGEPLSLSLPYDTGGEDGSGQATIDLSPARAGDNTLHIRLTDPEGLPTTADEVRLALTLPAEDIGPLRHDPLHVDVGHWTVTDLQLPRPGTWELALTIRTSDIDQVTETTSFTID
ncbi:hypothetical protein E1265_20260 [Streptomyces sp. 8K308]|uniref:copper resistance CopC/CopD family protein n=1 Tax=Streptomyces sp. 8K308 TaxID=2530388 RepID=UPI00104A4E3A|nr:copper resistance protein CopC [Streptomyces sp. 8K308]TDC20812.1 hypothetical protein E1265_20260 [Streptomyces sp. 8K308]